MSVEPAAAGTVPASSSSLMPDISPVSTPATNGHDASSSTNTSTNSQANGNAKPSLDEDLMAVWNRMNPPRERNGRFAGNGKDTESAETSATETTKTES